MKRGQQTASVFDSEEGVQQSGGGILGGFKRKPLLVGVTGNIGAGKSSVCRELCKMGVAHVDADQLAREAVYPGTEGLNAIVKEFGPGLLNERQQLDRVALGKMVFGSIPAKAKLEGILHPLIRALAEQKIEAHQSNGDEIIVYEAALLLESNGTDFVDKVVVVTASKEVRLARIRQRDDLPRIEIERRMSSQMDAQEQMKGADYVLVNDGDYAKLNENCIRLNETMRSWLREKNS